MNSTDSKTTQRYNRLAEGYEERWNDYLTHTHSAFLDEIETDSDDTILDLSCGTGLLAEQLINHSYPFKKLVLNDIASGMQQKAKERLVNREDITFTNFPAEKLDFETSSFTKLFCLNSFHNYNHQQKVLQECRRILQMGGQLYILDWNCSGFFKPVNWMIKLTGDEHIDTKSETEIYSMLTQNGFTNCRMIDWYYKYWKFYYVMGK